MLVKLTNNDIIFAWDMIKGSFEHAPNGEDLKAKADRVMERLLLGEGQAWFLLREDIPVACALTFEMFDPFTGEKNLFLYYAYAFEKLTARDWVTAFVYLKNYAKGIGCKEILTYSKVPKVIEMAEAVGGNSDARLLTFSTE